MKAERQAELCCQDNDKVIATLSRLILSTVKVMAANTYTATVCRKQLVTCYSTQQKGAIL